MGEWLTANQIAGLPGLPLDAKGIRRRAEQLGWESRRRAGKGGGLEYPVEVLSIEQRIELGKRASAEAAEEGRAAARREVVSSILDEAAAKQAQERGLAKMTAIAGAEKTRAEARIAAVAAFKAFKLVTGLSDNAASERFASAWSRGEIEIDAAVKALLPSVSGKSIIRWRDQAVTEGAARLGGNYGKHRVGAGVIDSDPEIKAFILAMIVEFQDVAPKMVMRGLRARYDEDRLPAFRTLQRWMSDWRQKNAQLDLFINHPDGWKNKYKAAGGNASASVVALNQRWEIDSTKADILLKDGGRHVIVGVIDVWSRRKMLFVSRSSSAQAVKALLRKAILAWGVPGTIVTDNGSDYVSANIKAVLAGLDIDQDVAAPFTPEHKPHIERALGTFNHGLIELLPRYVGHDVAARKRIEGRKSFAQRMMTAGAEVDLGMTAAELQDFCDRWANEVYGREEHSALKMSPFAKAASWPGMVRRISDERALDLLLAEPVSRDGHVVTKKGLTIQRHHYDAAELGGMEGRRVTARWDETDISKVYVFADTGEFLCIAECPELGGTGATRQEVTARRQKRQRHVMAEGVRALKKEANQIGVGDIVREILDENARKAGKLVDLPRSSIAHGTAALTQSGRAAAGPKKPEFTEKQKAIHQQLVAEAAARPAATVHKLATRDERFNRALDIEARRAAREPIPADDARWYANYATSSEYRIRKEDAAFFDRKAAGVAHA